MSKNKIHTRKIRRELRKAKSDLAALSQYLKECEIIFEDYSREWSRDLSFVLEEMNVKSRTFEDKEFNQVSTENYQEFESKNAKEDLDLTSKSDIPDWVKKSFRKIALKTHPDRVKDSINSEDLISIYEKANSAIIEKDYNSIIDICQKIGIEVEVDPEIELKTVVDKQEVVKNKLMSLDKSPEWLWGESYGMINKRVNFLKNVLVSAFSVKDLDDSKLTELVERLEEK